MKRFDEPIPKMGLPVAHILTEGNETKMYRLPFELADWVESCVGIAMSGGKMFPSYVEFGIAAMLAPQVVEGRNTGTGRARVCDCAEVSQYLEARAELVE